MTAAPEASLARPVILPARPAVVSFTFDVLGNGMPTAAEILTASGLRGTFYLPAGSISARSEGSSVGAALRRAGHEFGRVILADDANGARVTGPARHASYNHDAIADADHDGWAGRFATVRGHRPGINRGLTDAMALRANPLHGASRAYQEALVLIEDVARRGGWLIFVAQGASDAPGALEAHTIALKHVIGAAQRAGCLIEPVGEAFAMLAEDDDRAALPAPPLA